jgi:hypothetical protein
MNDSDLLKRLPRVAAPADFEDGVRAGLQARLRDLPGRRRARTFRWVTAGTAAGVLALFAGLNLFVLRGPSSAAVSASRAGIDASSRMVALNEPVNYRHEVRMASYEPGTIYILEQVSDASHTLYKY